MNSNTFRMPARRRHRAAAVMAAAALTAGPVFLAAPAGATGGPGEGGTGDGRASAVVLRAGLDVSLLGKTVDVPLRASLNEVQAPASAERTALSVGLDGVDQGRPFSVLRADVATAKATADARRAKGYTRLAHAKVHVPGLPLLSLVEIEEVTSSAVCEAGKRPVADSNLLGQVTVLGKKVTLSAGGPTRVEVPGVGEVTLDLSQTRTTTRTAAATALGLTVSVNPLKLNVAEVQGTLTLAEATCEAPKAPAVAPEPERPEPSEPTEAQAPAEPEQAGLKPQSAAEPERASLAETGGDSATPYLAGGAAALLAVGAGALALTRRARARR
ncbi:SCO1860 family LAETG-anchored protein [Streptomyces sp. JV176]|uniref:SCO1860 family LAETG-anchored protein n=1 Tax=Streptomyces sp. JV176 TaxID=858630 RepID=UPI002E78DDBB|nr:SCO1860 family LAETG-anchored protein [Streptomyces sp. JV176]MEE1801798.1 SCO1860 family LAETG-anchored protein [Streptomyces sp. JV176]